MTYPEAGPSRSVPPPRREEAGRPPWPRRGGDDERDRDRDRDDGRARLSEPASRPSPGNWSRPSSRSYRPGTGARSNTPSPTRRFDRDRDRDRFGSETRRGPGPGTGPASGNGPRDRDWDNRRWDRDRRDDRFRDFSPPRGGPSSQHRPSPQPPSYGGLRQHSPPRGPRVFSNGVSSTTPFNQADRVIPGARPLTGNGSSVQYKGTTTSGPSNTNGAGNGSIVVPRAPRSMRGSSSPVELRHTISDTAGSSSVPSRVVSLPVSIKEEVVDENDLEEGEVVSPVRRPLEPVNISRPGDRWHNAPPPVRRRGSTSPRKQPFRPRLTSPDPRDRDRDRARIWDRDRDRNSDWNRERRSYRRSLSPIATRPQDDQQATIRPSERSPLKPQSPNALKARDSAPPIPVKERSPPRPSTPPIPSPVTRLHSSLGLLGHDTPSRPDTPRLPDPGVSAVQESGSDIKPVVGETEIVVTDRPITPELPLPSATAVETPTQTQQQQEAVQSPRRSPGRIASPSRAQTAASPAVKPKAAEEVKVHVNPADEVDVAPAAESTAVDSPEVTKTSLQPIATPASVAPTLVSETPVTPAFEQVTETPRMEIDQDTPAAQTKIEVDADMEQIMEGIVRDKDEDGQREESANTTLQQLISPSGHRITIAERRSVKLPDTTVPLSSPFGDRIRKDSMPTAGSNQTSNTDADAETEGGPRTAEIKEDQQDAELSDGATEELKRIRIAKAIKQSVNKSVEIQEVVDLSHIYVYNKVVAPAPSSRASKHPLGRHRNLQKAICRFDRRLDTSMLVHVNDRLEQEKRLVEEKTKRLRLEYRRLNRDWQQHCQMLEEQMAARGPPPADLYGEEKKKPGASEAAAPGPAPSTPVHEEMPVHRGTVSRRRGGAIIGDGFTSEAGFKEILAELDWEANKDPTNRAHKTAATVPDMLLGPDRKLVFDDDNDLVRDPTTFYDFAGTLEPIWTAEEKEIFRRVYPNSAKQFQKVADKLPNKSVGDCVQYYYRTKKDIDWKGLVAAKKGGERKRNRAAVVKRPGKSSALLANLDRSKPTADPNSNAPGKSTITPARPGKGSASGSGSRQRDGGSGAATPSEAGGVKRRAKHNTLDVVAGAMADGVSSESTSRAGSETPAAAKAKMRMSIKGKRPRISSMTGVTNADQSSLSVTGEGTNPDVPAGTSGIGDPQAELLPPPKRPGKRRKTVVIGGSTDGAPDASGASGAGAAGGGGAVGDKPSKPRRGNTNSYWSVDEKQQIHDHYLALGPDFERIASRLPGKSLRQVTRQVKKQMMGWLDPDAAPGASGEGQADSNDRSGTQRALPLSVDMYGTDYSAGHMQHPRLGTFPSAQSTSPPKPFSRLGGMQISNLLNNNDAMSSGSKPNLDALEAASDGTVEDDAMGRPPSRSVGSGTARPAPAAIEHNRPPDLDRYKTRHESAFLPPSNHPHMLAAKATSSAFYPSRSEYPVQHPHPPPQHSQSQSQSQSQPHRSWDQPSYHHSTQHHPYPASVPNHPSRQAPGSSANQPPMTMGHRRPSHGQPHPHGLPQHGQPPNPNTSSSTQPTPQMGVFAAPSTPGFQGRTVYSAKREQEMGLPPPARNRGRSDGPAFSGFPPVPTPGTAARREEGLPPAQAGSQAQGPPVNDQQGR